MAHLELVALVVREYEPAIDFSVRVQRTVVGEQFAGRVGFFLRVDDCDASFARLVAGGVSIVSPSLLYSDPQPQRSRRHPLPRRAQLRARLRRGLVVDVRLHPHECA